MTKLQAAFLDKYDLHRKYVARMFSRHADPDDVMQVTYIQLGREEYNPDNMENYIKQSIFRTMLNERRRNKHFRGFVEVYDNLIVTERTPEDEAHANKFKVKLAALINSEELIDKVLRLKVLDQMTNTEISKHLKCSQETVRNSIRNARSTGKLDILKELL